MKRKKITLKEKKALSKKKICWRCGGKITKSNAWLCEKCEPEESKT